MNHLRTGQQLAALLAVGLLLAPLAPAQDHVLPLAELHGAMARQHGAQQSDQAQIDAFLAHERVQTAFNRSGISVERLRQATLLLSAEDHAKLAARVRLAEQEVAGGLTDSQITLVLIAGTLFIFMTVLVLAFG